ncbi:MAG: choice-of-anchor J domain-containing protein [Bacteroidota bacterium]
MRKITLLCLIISTFCWQAKAQFTESFETEIPASWTVINNGSIPGWIQTNTPAVAAQDGTGVASISFDSATPHDDYLITPAITVAAGTNDRISFYVRSRSSFFLESYEVLLSTTDAMDTSFTVVLQAEMDAPAAAWEQIEFDLSAYVGQTVYVAIRATGFDEFNLYVDNVVNDTPPACPDPTMLSATNITDTEAELSWTENGTATVWDVEIVTNGTPPTGTPTASGVGNPYNASGLMENTSYDFYVRADCGGDGTSMWAGPFTFTTLETCPSPSAGNATNIMETSADLNWTENGTATVWDIELVLTGEAPTGTPTAAGVGNPYNATGLTGNTGYDFYVRAVCGGPFGSSIWAGPFTFRTECPAVLSAPYTEDFEEFTTSLSAFVSGNCWSATGGLYFWEAAPGTDTGSGGTGPDPSITTGNYFYTEASDGSAGDVADLVSPSVDLTALTTPALIFDYHMHGGDMGTLDVLVNGTDNVFSLSGEQQATATAPFDQAVIDLSAYAGQTITVVFRGTSAGTFEGDISIDNVSFTELPTCFAPSAGNATNIMETSADLNWTENGTATVWNIELVDITAGGTVTGTATATGVANPYMATGLVGDNVYEFYVQADCGSGGVSAWAGPFTFSTPIPDPTCTSGIFLDSGGAAGNYSNSENITYTICPDMAGDVVNVEFTSFSLENDGPTACWDDLTIYDGADTTAPTIDSPNGPGWCWDRSDTTPAGSGDLQGMMITSSDPSGCLTFVFSSDGSQTRAGWSADVTCAPLSVESAQVRGFIHYVNTVNKTFVVNAQSNIDTIEIYNLSGQVITTATPKSPAGEAFLGSVSKGVYFARVTLENGSTSVVKFVR